LRNTEDKGKATEEGQSQANERRAEGQVMSIPIRLRPVGTMLWCCALLGAMLTCAPARAGAATPPVKLVPSGHLSHELRYPESVAVAPDGDIYVTDRGHDRVQELTAGGGFVSMFGREVNETKVKAVKAKGGTPTQKELEEENICTAVSGDACKAGVEGAAAAALGEPQSIAIAKKTGDLYIQDQKNERVDEYTATGEFVLTFGREVNETKAEAVKAKGGTPTQKELEEENVCTAVSGNTCKAGVTGASGNTERATFNFAEFAGDLLAVAGPSEELLYVGDEQRVQEFDTETGEWKGEISLKSISAEPESRVVALAVDGTGELYLVYSTGVGFSRVSNVIRVFDPSGIETAKYELAPDLWIEALALDAAGRLAVSAISGSSSHAVGTGLLLDASTGEAITEFSAASGDFGGISFSGSGDLYAAVSLEAGEVSVYEPVAVAEVLASSAECVTGADQESSATFDCSLKGDVNPFEVAETEAWFQWGPPAALEMETPRASIATTGTPIAVHATIEGLSPNTAFQYRVAANDHNVKSPELLSSKKVSFSTPLAAPRVIGGPSAQFVGSASAVLYGEVNPENAQTEYFFEYAPELGAYCQTGSPRTGTLESSAYRKLGVTLQADGLQPATTYHDRLCATNQAGDAQNEHGESTVEEGQFTTLPAPVPIASTGAPSAVGSTTATVSGTVDPDGQPATYAFELGVYEGANTQYGIVLSASAGTGTTPTMQTLGLTGLQPGSTYAYRIEIASGYGTMTGAPVLFTTAGLPEALPVPTTPTMLAVPPVVFPAASSTKSKVPVAKTLTSTQKLAKALEACKKQPKSKRASCEKQARKTYAKQKQANDQQKG
jgi:NHL repeat